MSIEQLAVVILNYNGKHFLEKFLPSVVRYSQPFAIYVADNASTDDSIDYLKANFPQIGLIELPENGGFSRGYNQALAQIKAKYYVLLNSDVEVTAHWITPVLKILEDNPQIAICQPKLKDFKYQNRFEYAGAGGGYIDKYGYPFCRGRLFSTLEDDQGQYEDEREVFWAGGACMFVRAEVYHALGGLDEAFFAHMEEIDLCWRAQNVGYLVYYNPQSQVYHVGGGTLPQSSPRKTFLNFRNNLALLYKNLPQKRLNRVLFARFWLDGLAMVYFIVQGKPRLAWVVVQAYVRFYGALKHWKMKRKINNPPARQKNIYPKSIVWQYFVQGKKKFNDL
jgi:hypothetical protein